jgi:N-acetylglucosamine-6-phosphate deacetylase
LTERHWILAHRLYEGGGALPLADILVEVEGERILSLRPATEAPEGVTPRTFPIVAPGFIDLQINGGGGVLFNDTPTVDGVRRIAIAARRGGTSHILPTFITDAGIRYADALDAVADAIALGVPGVLGVHLEGPFLAPTRPGIHPARFIRAMTDEDVARLSAFGHPLLLTLAPEAQEATHLAQLRSGGVTLFAGHSEATIEDIARAADLGLSGVTHLWNAMSQLQGRAPGVVGAALTDRRLSAGIIADGLHVHPANLLLAASAMGNRLFLVTDAMPSLGCDVAGFSVGGVPIRLEHGRLVSPDGTLAGAHLAMDEAVRNMVALAGVSVEVALDMASGRPASVLGLGDVFGRIAPGYRASLTCLDPGLHTIAVMVDGKWPDSR